MTVTIPTQIVFTAAEIDAMRSIVPKLEKILYAADWPDEYWQPLEHTVHALEEIIDSAEETPPDTYVYKLI